MKTNSRVTFIGIDGWPIADSINNSIIFDDHSYTPEFRNAIKGDRAVVKKYSEEIGKKYSYLSIPPIKVGDRDVILRLGDSYDEVDHIVEEFVRYLVVATFIGILFAITISYVSVKKLLNQLKSLRLHQDKYQKVNLTKINVHTNDEIEELSVSFNQMATRLKETINQLKDANADLDAILSSINDGIIALDKENNITLVNEGVKKILDIDIKGMVGQNIIDALRDIECIGQIEEGVNSPDDFYTEIKIEEQIPSM